MGVYRPTVGQDVVMIDDTGSDMVMSWTVAKAGWGDETSRTPFSPAAAMTSFAMGALSVTIMAEHPILMSSSWMSFWSPAITTSPDRTRFNMEPRCMAAMNTLPLRTDS